ncbi:hypothetical protein V8C86DRAFT_3165328, partial [Haematococcus lacustris]
SPLAIRHLPKTTHTFKNRAWHSSLGRRYAGHTPLQSTVAVLSSMDEEGRRLAVALAIVKAKRSTAQVRELESRAEAAEARLKKLRAGCGVLVSVLQKHMQAGQSGALVSKLMASLGPAPGSEPADDISTLSASVQCAVQQQVLTETWRLAPSDQSHLQQRETALSKLLQAAQGVQLVSTILHSSEPAGGLGVVGPSVPSAKALQAFCDQSGMHTLVAFVQDTLITLAPSELRKAYMAHAATLLTAALHAACQHAALSADTGSPAVQQLQEARLVGFAADVDALLDAQLQLACADLVKPPDLKAGTNAGPTHYPGQRGEDSRRPEAAQAFLQHCLSHPSLAQLLLVVATRWLGEAAEQLRGVMQGLAQPMPASLQQQQQQQQPGTWGTGPAAVGVAAAAAAGVPAVVLLQAAVRVGGASHKVLALVDQCLLQLPTWLLALGQAKSCQAHTAERLPQLQQAQQGLPNQAMGGAVSSSSSSLLGADPELSLLTLAVSHLLHAHQVLGEAITATTATTITTTEPSPAAHGMDPSPGVGSEPEVESAAAAAAPGARQGRVAWLRGGSVPGPCCLLPFTAAAVQQRVAQLATGLQHCLMAQHSDQVNLVQQGGRAGRLAVSSGAKVLQGAARARVIQLCQQVKQALLPA